MCETKLKPVNHMSINNYDLIRRDRLKNIEGGGVAIGIKSKFSYQVIKNKIFDNFICIEPCIISLQLEKRKKLFVVSIYAPQNDSNVFLTELEKNFDILNLSDSNNYYILAGDFNAKHGSWSNNTNPCNPRGTQLYKWLQDNNLSRKCQLYATDLPTYPRTNSFLDFAIIDSRLNVDFSHSVNKLTTLPYDSDHNAFCLPFSIDSFEEKLIPFSDHRKLNFNNVDWVKFKIKLDQNYLEEYIHSDIKIKDNCNIPTNHIDYNLAKLNKVILKTMKEVIPKVDYANSMSKFFTNTVKKLIKKKT
jgi:hypothetical protein